MGEKIELKPWGIADKISKKKMDDFLKAIEAIKKTGILIRIAFFDGECWRFIELPPKCPKEGDGYPTRCTHCGAVPFVNPCPNCCYWYCTKSSCKKGPFPPTQATCPYCGTARTKSPRCQ